MAQMIDLLNPDAPIVPFAKKQGSRLPAIKNFTVKEGKIERIMLIEPIVYVLTHYKGRYFKCMKESTQDTTFCQACQALGNAKYRFGTNIILYKTEANGDLVEPLQWEIVLWTHRDESKINEIQRIKKEWKDLKSHDLKVACSNEKFQNLYFTPTADAVWNQSKEIHDKIFEDYQKNRYDVDKIINKPITQQEMEAILLDDSTNFGGKFDSKAKAPSFEPKKPVAKSPEVEVVDFDKLIQEL